MNITLTNNFKASSITTPNLNKKEHQNKYFNRMNNQADTFTRSSATSPKKFSFTGVTRVLPQIPINSIDDIVGQWEKMKFAPYYEALDDKKFAQNKPTRLANFGFLENVPQHVKAQFIEYFKEFTGFPNYAKVSENIENEYIKIVHESAQSVSPNVKVVVAGYDPTCSVGMKMAFPGTDLDKAYVVLKNDSCKNSYQVLNEFKGHLWFNTDQRVLSLNNEDTFPEVYTLDGIKYTLGKLNKVVRNLWLNSSLKQSLQDLRNFELNPAQAGLFNTMVAKNLPYEDLSKEYVKNFAYFIESVRDGRMLVKDEELSKELFEIMDSSPFVHFSNVTQMGALNTLIQHNLKPMKTKLLHRQELAENFDRLSVDEQFEVIKDIIKSVSKDNENPQCAKYFENDDNIKERYDKLNRLLLM